MCTDEGRQKLVVAPRRNFTASELEPLLEELGALGFDVEVTPFVNPHIGGRAGVTWWETIHVYLPHFMEAIVEKRGIAIAPSAA